MHKRTIKLGDKFGNFTIVSEPFNHKGYPKIKCRCSCGKVLIKYCCEVGKLTQCKACAVKKKYHIYKKGDKKHKLTVIKYVQRKSKRLSIEVQCDCGQITIIHASSFGITKTCGCIRSKLGKEHHSYTGLEHISGTYFSQIKNNSVKKKLQFNLTLSYLNKLLVKQSHRCALSGLKIIVGSTKQETTASLDRINNTKGYIKGNVQWVHKDINHLKSNFPQVYFKKLCKLVAIT